MKIAVVTYQIGVDVLGFPVYIQHTIYQNKPSEARINPKNKWLKVLESFIKQH